MNDSVEKEELLTSPLLPPVASIGDPYHHPTSHNNRFLWILIVSAYTTVKEMSRSIYFFYF